MIASDSGDVAKTPQRDYARADVNLMVICQGRDEIYREFARVLGAGGMFVESQRPQEIGKTLSMEFELPGIPEPIALEAEVVWRREPGEQEPPGMGLRFVRVEAALREQIDRFVTAEGDTTGA